MPSNSDKLPRENKDRTIPNPLASKVKLSKRRKVTINDLFTRDDVNTILADLDKIKPDISDIIVIYIDKNDNRYHWQVAGGTTVSTAVWMLESAKFDFLSQSEEE